MRPVEGSSLKGPITDFTISGFSAPRNKASFCLCLNCVKTLKSPQPELLDQSTLFSLVKLYTLYQVHGY